MESRQNLCIGAVALIDDGAMSVTVASIGLRRVLTVTGEIDIATVDALRAALAAAVDAVERDVWVDLSRVGFMDSSGLHALMGARHALEPHRRRLTVIAPEGCARRTIEIAGLDGALRLQLDRESANRECTV